MKVSDCLTPVCVALIEHAERLEVISWIYAAASFFMLVAMVMHLWRSK